MKDRITITIDPEVAHRAKKLAHARKTSVSALIEDLLQGLPLSPRSEKSFVEKWAGKFSVAPSQDEDTRIAALKEKYRLPER